MNFSGGDNMKNESTELSLIYAFLHEHFEDYLMSDKDATDKMIKILKIIKEGE